MLIKKETSCYRPLYIKGIQLDNIIFYSEGVVKYESNCGWLEDYHNTPTYCDVVGLDTKEPKKANKLNLTRKDNFYLSSIKYGSKVYTLYLYCGPGSDIEVSSPTENILINTAQEIWYRDQFHIKIKAIVQKPVLENGEVLYRDTLVDQISVCTCCTRKVLTPLGIEIDNITSLLVDNNIDISRYQIEKMLRFVDIKIKKAGAI